MVYNFISVDVVGNILFCFFVCNKFLRRGKIDVVDVRVFDRWGVIGKDDFVGVGFVGYIDNFFRCGIVDNGVVY